VPKAKINASADKIQIACNRLSSLSLNGSRISVERMENDLTKNSAWTESRRGWMDTRNVSDL